MDTICDSLNCVILAAGEGKRMHAPHSKVLCEVAGKPMLRWVIDAVRADAKLQDVDGSGHATPLAARIFRRATGARLPR